MMYILLTIVILISAGNCQRVLKQISTTAAGHLTYYNTVVQKCLIEPYLCGEYDPTDTICMTGVSTFQNCVAFNCYPVEFYYSYQQYQNDYQTFGNFMFKCIQDCQETTLKQSLNPTWKTLTDSLNILVDCYNKYENKKETYDYYAYFFADNWQECGDQIPSCKIDQTYIVQNQQIKDSVKICVEDQPIFISNTAFVETISINQTSNCVLNAFERYSIDYQNSKCFSQLFQCGGFQILQPLYASLLQSTFIIALTLLTLM